MYPNGKAALIPRAIKIYALHGLHLGVLAPGSIQAAKHMNEEMLIIVMNTFLIWNTSLQAKL
jgi:hypothetical protein